MTSSTPKAAAPETSPPCNCNQGRLSCPPACASRPPAAPIGFWYAEGSPARAALIYGAVLLASLLASHCAATGGTA